VKPLALTAFGVFALAVALLVHAYRRLALAAAAERAEWALRQEFDALAPSKDPGEPSS
jgi:hypothetical protein